MVRFGCDIPAMSLGGYPSRKSGSALAIWLLIGEHGLGARDWHFGKWETGNGETEIVGRKLSIPEMRI
jgi:hypothetical protein